ncbi:MAG: caspase family protein [Bacteroidales bacterium]|nr:caspase family protein [Bacteroidales bacterium]
MKKLFVSLLIIFSALYTYAEKYALIIAIGEYDQDQTGWYPISAENDVPLIEKALSEMGFSKNNIMYLKDTAATKEGIENALLELYKKVNLGDQVVIHYSGHGQQIFDDNNDELDGLDEALVCFNAPMNMIDGYDGSKHFRDDELGDWITKFRIKLGIDGHILLFLDSCHSGTGTRGSAKVRGGAPPLVPKNWTPTTVKDNKLGFGVNCSSRGATTNKMAKFVVFSGASANELNYETYDDEENPVGSLSYCIYKAFSQMKQGDTYRQIFARIMAEMATKAPFQNPAIEGDIDYSVFNGNFEVQTEYYNLSSIKTDSLVEINAGSLAGINPGTIIAFAKPGTARITADASLINTGKVISSTNFNAIVALDNKMKFENNQSAWVFIQARTFTDQKIKISVDSKMDKDLKESLQNDISNLSFAEINNESPEISLKYAKTRGAKIITIKNAIYNQNLHKIANSDTKTLNTEVISTLNNYAQGKIIKSLDFYNEKYDVVMELIPVKARINEDGSFDILEYPDPNSILENNIPVFSPNIMALIKVTNCGTKKAYFNIIDIQPDGFINPVIPTPNDFDGREYNLDPGKTAILKNTLVLFGPPYGNETFKLIATDKAFNLSATILQHGSSTRGNTSNIFESALQIGKSGTNTRGASTVSAKTKDNHICTFEYTFKIVEN